MLASGSIKQYDKNVFMMDTINYVDHTLQNCKNLMRGTNIQIDAIFLRWISVSKLFNERNFVQKWIGGLNKYKHKLHH